MSTQQNNAEAADGHSFADKIGQLVSAKYQALFGTTTYSKRRVMSGVVMTRYVGSNMVQWTLVIVNSVLSPILFTNERKSFSFFSILILILIQYSLD